MDPKSLSCLVTGYMSSWEMALWLCYKNIHTYYNIYTIWSWFPVAMYVLCPPERVLRTHSTWRFGVSSLASLHPRSTDDSCLEISNEWIFPPSSLILTSLTLVAFCPAEPLAGGSKLWSKDAIWRPSPMKLTWSHVNFQTITSCQVDNCWLTDNQQRYSRLSQGRCKNGVPVFKQQSGGVLQIRNPSSPRRRPTLPVNRIFTDRPIVLFVRKSNTHDRWPAFSRISCIHHNAP